MPDLELLDCGDGRRLERFGAVVVDRPAPTAQMPRRLAASDWERPALRWAKGAWVRGAAADPWPVRVGGLTLECRPAAGGQVGLFPEHAATWDWLDRTVRGAAGSLGRPPEILSLFAYTGGATLACARAGARLAHVDSSRPAVAWARRNSELSGLAEAPVRWLVDDVRALVRRERRRGRRYDGIILDPPTYGHGAGAWEIEAHLPGLLDDLAALCGPRPSLVLLSAHTPGFDGDRLAALVREHFGIAAEGGPLALDARSGNRLALGAWARSVPRGAARPAGGPRSR
jgi:23S rRNA (cytosine1962-C5)-methyltransferase